LICLIDTERSGSLNGKRLMSLVHARVIYMQKRVVQLVQLVQLVQFVKVVVL